MRRAYRFCDVVFGNGLRFGRVWVHGEKQVFEEVPEPAEGDVVLGNFFGGIPCHPCVDCDGHGHVAEGGEGEVDACRCGRDILIADELENLVRTDWEADNGQGVAGCEESEYVFGV